MSEIRDEALDPAVVEAAAARVWAHLVTVVEAAAAPSAKSPTTRSAAAPISSRSFPISAPAACPRPAPAAPGPSPRVRRLPQGLRRPRGCHAGRRRRPPRPAPRPLGRGRRGGGRRRPVRLDRGRSVRSAAPAAPSCRPSTARCTKSPPTGIRPLAAGQDLPDGVEIRTAKDSDAMLQLRDGSVVELRERSGLSTTAAAGDLTIRLGRGSVIVQAAKRRAGHLYRGHRRLPRGRHRHPLRRQRGRQGLARFRGPGRSARLPGQPGEDAASPATRPSPAPAWSRIR